MLQLDELDDKDATDSMAYLKNGFRNGLEASEVDRAPRSRGDLGKWQYAECAYFGYQPRWPGTEPVGMVYSQGSHRWLRAKSSLESLK